MEAKKIPSRIVLLLSQNAQKPTSNTMISKPLKISVGG